MQCIQCENKAIVIYGGDSLCLVDFEKAKEKCRKNSDTVIKLLEETDKKMKALNEETNRQLNETDKRMKALNEETKRHLNES
jgi:predicted Ser/Thr protein kinase